MDFLSEIYVTYNHIASASVLLSYLHCLFSAVDLSLNTPGSSQSTPLSFRWPIFGSKPPNQPRPDHNNTPVQTVQIEVSLQ